MAPALRILDVSLGDVVSELKHERRNGFQGEFVVITRTTRVSCSSDDCDRFCMWTCLCLETNIKALFRQSPVLRTLSVIIWVAPGSIRRIAARPWTANCWSPYAVNHDAASNQSNLMIGPTVTNTKSSKRARTCRVKDELERHNIRNYTLM